MSNSLTDATPLFPDRELLGKIADAINQQNTQIAELRRKMQLHPWDAAYTGAATATTPDNIFPTRCFLDTVANNSTASATIAIYDGNVLKLTLTIANAAAPITSLGLPINDALNVTVNPAGAAVYLAGRVRW